MYALAFFVMGLIYLYLAMKREVIRLYMIKVKQNTGREGQPKCC